MRRKPNVMEGSAGVVGSRHQQRMLVLEVVAHVVSVQQKSSGVRRVAVLLALPNVALFAVSLFVTFPTARVANNRLHLLRVARTFGSTRIGLRRALSDRLIRRLG